LASFINLSFQLSFFTSILPPVQLETSYRLFAGNTRVWYRDAYAVGVRDVSDTSVISVPEDYMPSSLPHTHTHTHTHTHARMHTHARAHTHTKDNTVVIFRI